MRYRRIKGAVHIHTSYSDGSGTVAEIIDAAAAAGLEYLVVADHDTTAAREDSDFKRRDGVLPIGAVEISPARRGHCLAIGARQVAGYRWMPESFYLQKLRRDGADTYIAHPEGRVKRRFGINLKQWHAWDHEHFTGMEIWSYMHDWVDKVGWLNLPALYRNPASAIDGPDKRVLGLWDRLNSRRRVVGIGALDAHAVKMFFGMLVAFEYEFLFRTVLTHALVESWGRSEAEDELSLRSALREGRAFVAYEALFPGDAFRFESTDGLQMGARAPLAGVRTLMASVDRPAEITLVHNGSASCVTSGRQARFDVHSAGVYRVEVRVEGRPWIFSNPIYLGDD